MVDVYSKINKVYVRMKGVEFLERMNSFPLQEIFGHNFNLKKFYENNFRGKEATLEESEAFVEMLDNKFKAEELSTLKYTVEKQLQIYSASSSSQTGISAITIALFALFITSIASMLSADLSLSGAVFVVFIFVVVVIIISCLAYIKRKDKREMDAFRQVLICIELAQYRKRTE